MKYITYSTGQAMPGILIFPDYLQHAHVGQGRNVLSAGFIDLDNKHCYGDSVSLGIKADPERDTPILRAMLSTGTETAA